MKITSLFARLALALTLVTGAGAAVAAPVSYHFNIDTANFAAADGYFDLQLLNYDGANASSAVVSNFSGGASVPTFTDGSASGDLSTSVTLIGSGYNVVDQLIHFGGLISFDVLFDFAATGETSGFTGAFYDTGFTTYLGGTGPFASILLNPGVGIDLAVASYVTISQNAAAVPEPAAWMLMALGLSMMGAMARRRNV